MTEKMALGVCRSVVGYEATIQEQNHIMSTTGTNHTLYYCWLGDVIKGIGGSWEDLVSDVKERAHDKTQESRKQ